MHPSAPDNEAMSEVRSEAIHKQYGVVSVDIMDPHLACFTQERVYKLMHTSIYTYCYKF